MSQGNQNPELQAEQIDIIRKKPSLKFQPEENYQKDQSQIGRQTLIHASHQLGGVFLFIVTAIKLLGLNKFTTISFTIAILIIISSLLWILSVAIGTIGIRRQKPNSLIFYFLGILVSFIIEFSSTIVIMATNHIADHQLGIYNKNVVIRIIIFMTLEFMVILFQIMMLRSVRQIRQLFIDIERLQIENQSNNQIEIEKML
ncbi:unnamed protein product [Paramecium pentaurelia]|uniref:Transmembrane protein n=1 Tax=Paramecium pentaurelia TaxID=43138 RepID=A0A8S1RVW3_9CILI|nr:unnamed protein product [Paramecium pentaurelia]